MTNYQKIAIGMILIVVATVFIMGGLGFLMYGQPIIATDIDILISFGRNQEPTTLPIPANSFVYPQ